MGYNYLIYKKQLINIKNKSNYSYMKLYIYIALFVILIVYVNSHSNYLTEKFADTKKINNLDAPNPYNVLKTDKVKPILIEGNSELVPGYDPVTNDKYWQLKLQGFSDIYNYEDKGGLDIFLQANDIQNQLNFEFAPVKKEEKKSEIKDETKKKIIPNTLEYNKKKYYFVGTASNEYYSQYYYLFELAISQDKKDLNFEEELKYVNNNRIYEYLLVKIHKNNPQVSHYVGPRNKIKINDVVYFSLGNFQLGPLVIKKLN